MCSRVSSAFHLEGPFISPARGGHSRSSRDSLADPGMTRPFSARRERAKILMTLATRRNAAGICDSAGARRHSFVARPLDGDVYADQRGLGRRDHWLHAFVQCHAAARKPRTGPDCSGARIPRCVVWPDRGWSACRSGKCCVWRWRGAGRPMFGDRCDCRRSGGLRTAFMLGGSGNYGPCRFAAMSAEGTLAGAVSGHGHGRSQLRRTAGPAADPGAALCRRPHPATFIGLGHVLGRPCARLPRGHGWH